MRQIAAVGVTFLIAPGIPLAHRKMYAIRGILRLTSPLHIAAARKEIVDSDTDRLLPSGERGIAVVPATKYRLPMFLGQLDETEGPHGPVF